MKLSIGLIAAPLREAFTSAADSSSVRELFLIRLKDSQGRFGFGEAAPLESYDGVSLDDCRAALMDCEPVLAASDGRDHVELIAECAQRAVLPQAVAAVDLALWDLAGRRHRQPVWRLLGATDSIALECNQTIAVADRAGAVARSIAAREAGYRTVKMKVGVGDDAGRVAAVRAAAGAEMAIRLDANGAWTVPEAAASLRSLALAGIELCEEPVHGLDQTAELARLTDVPLALDETGAAPGALDHRVCDAVCLKIGRCGGITGLIDAARRARVAGYEVYLASTLDGPLGIAAAVHAAAVIKPDRPSGLATIGLFRRGLDRLEPRGGHLRPPPGPGLGDDLAAWYEA